MLIAWNRRTNQNKIFLIRINPPNPNQRMPHIMSTAFTADTKISPPKWDGKRETFDVYDWQFRNFAALSSLSDALEPSIMANCPTKTEYSALDKLSTDPAVLAKIKIYRDNEKLCGMFVYGNNSAVGKAALKATSSADFPLGLIHVALDRLADSYIPKDITAEIDLENQVQQVRFKRGTEYYAEVTEVLSHFTCTLSEKELIKDMAKKTQNSTYAKMISDELRKPTPNFKLLCDELDSVQRLAGLSLSGSKSNKKEKEVALASQEKSKSDAKVKSNCSYCNGKHKRKDCKKLKAALEKQGKCPHCDKEGHLDSECFIKHPEKKPSWFGKKSKGGSETSANNLEIQVVNIDSQDFF